MVSSELAIFKGVKKIAYLLDKGVSDWQLVYLEDCESSDRVSMRLPTEKRAIDGPDVVAFFRNYLPATQVCRAVSDQLGLSVGNDFGLCGALCGENFGALRMSRPGGSLLEQGDLRPISGADLRNLIAAMGLNPMLTEVEGFRNSLPGDQIKLPIRVEGQELCLPLGAELSSHLVKTARDGRRESLQNESFCTYLADQLDLPVSPIELRHGSITYLLVERFDRLHTTGHVEALHAEDFLQLAMLPPEKAFQREGGLSIADCVSLLRRYSTSPALDIKLLLRWVMFNFMIGNGHATGKQLALLHTQQGPRLAPFYGIRSTHVYENLNQRTAMSIGSEDRPDWIIAARWREFAQRSEIKPRFIFELLETMAVELMDKIIKHEQAWRDENGYASITTSIRQLVERRARQILVSLQAEAA